MWELDLDTVSVGRSCDGNTVRGLRAVCRWALANNMINGRRDFCFSYATLGGCDAGMAEQDLDHSTEELRNALRANQKGGYTLLMKAVAEAIIELAGDSRYVGGTATEKSITPRPHSIQRSFRIGCARKKKGRSTEDPFFQQRTG